MKKLIWLLFMVVISVLPLLTGCGGGDSGAARYFLLDVYRTGDKLQTSGGNIYVKTFKIASPFDRSNLVYKKAGNDYESDYYNRFMVSPEVQITEQCRNWLGRAGIFDNVINPASLIKADYILEGNIVSLYGDFSETEKALAVMEIKFFLIKQTKDEPVILFSRSYKEEVEVSNEDADKLVSGYYECLEEIFRRFEKDVAELGLK